MSGKAPRGIIAASLKESLTFEGKAALLEIARNEITFTGWAELSENYFLSLL